MPTAARSTSCPPNSASATSPSSAAPSIARCAARRAEPRAQAGPAAVKRAPMAAPDSSGWGMVAGCVLAAAAAWLLVFEVHLWIDSLVQGDSGLHWVFLPAAVGLLAVLVGSWAGAGGIFIGSLLTGPQHAGGVPLDGLFGAALCALAPML